METIKRMLVITHSPTGKVTKRVEVVCKVTPKRLTIVEGAGMGTQFHPETGGQLTHRAKMSFYRKHLEIA